MRQPTSPRLPLLLAAVLLVAAVALVHRRSEAPAPLTRQPGPSARPPALVAPPVAPAAPLPAPAPPPAPPPEAAATSHTAWLTALREKYGGRLDDPRVRIRLLEDVVRYAQATAGERWEQVVLALLAELFPAEAGVLEATFRGWRDYRRWSEDTRGYLAGLSPEERQAAQWEARRRFFGEAEAERIWAAERQHQAEAAALREVDAEPGLTVPARLARYKQRLAETHGAGAAAYVSQHQQEVLNRFLSLSSVQRELADSPPPLRASHLREVRRELGLDEAALQRWEALDRERDGRWERGARYMAERAALVQQLSGPALEEALAALRARTFGTEGEVLAQEEAAGFFRFAQERQYGRN